MIFWQTAMAAPSGAPNSTSSAHKLNRPEIPSGLALSFSKASLSIRTRAFTKHPSRSADLKQRLSLIASRAAREIAQEIRSLPSQISKITRLPSQRGRDGVVIQLKCVMTITPSDRM